MMVDQNEKSMYFHDLIDIGNQIFKDARSTNILEEKAIDRYFRSKTKVIIHEDEIIWNEIGLITEAGKEKNNE